jgi:hypothetical protein
MYFLVFANGEYMMIGEVFIDGQNRDVWCNSKKPITDLKMYFTAGHLTDPVYATTPSCYVLNYSYGTQMSMYLRSGSECLSSGASLAEYLICE